MVEHTKPFIENSNGRGNCHLKFESDDELYIQKETIFSRNNFPMNCIFVRCEFNVWCL